MALWKVALGPSGPQQLKYRAIIDADSFDIAVAVARRRFPLLRFAAVSGQRAADGENLEAWLVGKGL